ncbi:glycosyl hydrolase 5 family protein-like [Phoenix dactylifera]|uniref:Glycosyl hydrolase 5 family protein-like n=1 Tax=Phoenix dactylifera TaxID=42345 RepID=A0A8B9A3D9_PHODC|nr:glycosyl hydrolase 5 family protein-like [Phoenix dactylifera]
MKIPMRPLLYLLLLSFLPSNSLQARLATSSPSLPLSTSSRWIVDGNGRRVKLACVNWAAHLEAAAAEGLGKQPLDTISRRVVALGFNCVRLTWPLYLLTNASLGSLPLRASLAGLGLLESAAAVAVNNPALLDLPLLQAFQAVVSNLASNNIMVILDNQISKPGWCCSKFDENGFFGDKYFDPDEWLRGLTMMATMFNSSANVVGMSLRNELRGPKQNISLWYRYMQIGAEAVHAANPDLLIILSGLDYDKDLSFLSEKQVKLTFTDKVVFELHWYGFSDGGDWENGNPNEVCGSVVDNMTKNGGFLLEQGWPLFLSEFGVDQSGRNMADNRFLSCFLSVAAELDLDWALWALQGSYYIREGQLGYDETYGVLGWDWCKARNSSFVNRIAALQAPFQGPGLSNNSPYDIIFHPLTGLCVVKKSSSKNLLELGLCANSEAWNYTAEQNVMLEGTKYCMLAKGAGRRARLGTGCGGSNSIWELISDSRMHVSSKLPKNGSTVCLDISQDGTIITNLCKCLSQDGTCNPDSQWFKIIRSTRERESQTTHLKLPSQA